MNKLFTLIITLILPLGLNACSASKVVTGATNPESKGKGIDFYGPLSLASGDVDEILNKFSNEQSDKANSKENNGKKKFKNIGAFVINRADGSDPTLVMLKRANGGVYSETKFFKTDLNDNKSFFKEGTFTMGVDKGFTNATIGLSLKF